LNGIVCDAGISKHGIGGKKVRIKVFDLSKKKEIFTKEYEKKSDNNLAELEAIYEAVKIAHFRQDIFTDSLTAIGWILNPHKAPSQEISKLVKKINKLVFLKELSIKHWNKNELGKNPADCKKKKPSKGYHKHFSRFHHYSS